MLAKLKPEPNAEAVPGADAEPKIDVDVPVPKADELAEPNSDGEVLAPNAEPDAPNMEVIPDEVEPKGLEVDEAPKGEEPKAAEDDPKPVLPKAGVFGAKGLEGVGDENGFADD